MTEEVDFPFMSKVGKRVGELFFGDPDQVDWCNKVVDHHNETGEYPPDTIEYILDVFSAFSDEESIRLRQEIIQIIKDPENIENLLNEIFLYDENEEEATPESNEASELIIPESYEDENEEKLDEDDPTPEEYFENEIKKTMKLLGISYDFSYVLLSKFDFSRSKAQSEWFSNKKEVLKLLKIDLGGQLVPNVKSDLCVFPSTGECPICYSDANIVELYCGHKICKDCLIQDIEQQLKENTAPRCRSTEDDTNTICGAEIMSREVERLLSPEQYQLYRKVMLRDKIIRDFEVKECPNPYCDWIITPRNKIPCHVGRCPKCHSVTCLLCDQECHAPLLNCKLRDDFCIKVLQEMRQLAQDQESWLAREERLKDYRRLHVSEVTQVLGKVIDDLRKKQKEEAKKDQAKLSAISKVREEKQEELSALRRKLNKMLEEMKPKNEVRAVTDKIDELTEEYNKINAKVQLFEKDIKIKNSERDNNLAIAQKEDGYFIEALTGGYYQFNMTRFKEIQNERVMNNLPISFDDDDYIRSITKTCPKCKAQIQRAEGCNYMRCNRCQFEFCWACDEPWHPKHSNHFECPNYKISSTKGQTKSTCGIDFNDMNDFKFYPQPMSIEKREDYVRFQNLYTKFQKKRVENKEFFNKLMDNVDKEDQSDQKFKSLSSLCPINRLVEIMSQDTNRDDARNNALKILNTCYFADLIALWSYPALFYMAKKPEAAKLFEFRVSTLEEKNEHLKSLIFAGDMSLSTQDFMTSFDLVDKDILLILDVAETF